MPKIVPSQIVEFIGARFQNTISEPPKAFSCDYNSAGTLSTLLDLVDQLPANLIPLESWKFIRFSEACQEIKNAIALWHSGQPNALIYELRYMRDGSSLNPVAALRDVLSKCPDQGISIPEEELSFLEDEDFRRTISQDISSANQALANAEWKAATVLSGSVVEALLLSAIERLRDRDSKKYGQAVEIVTSDTGLGKGLSNKPKGNPNGWTFDEYIHVAFTTNLLSESTARECLLTKNYRNLIHHGASERKKQKCDRGTALVAVAAMEHVIKELRDKKP